MCVCVCVCVCVLKRQIDGGCGGSESGGETLILIMNQIFYSKKKKIMNQILKFLFFS